MDKKTVTRQKKAFYFGKIDSAPLPDYPDKMVLEPQEVQNIEAAVDPYTDKLIDGQFQKITAGMSHCMLLTSTGKLFGFGMGLRGQLGLGKETIYQRKVVKILLTPEMEKEDEQREEVEGEELPPKYVRMVKAGPDSTCAIDSEEVNNLDYYRAWVWGQNSYGSLGEEHSGKDILQPTLFKAFLTEECDVEDEDTKSVPEEDQEETLDSKRKKVPKKIHVKKIKHIVKKKPVTRFVDVALGLHHALFLSRLPKGVIFSVGKKERLGTGEEENSEATGIVSGIREYLKSVECGLNHSFAWNEKGVIYSWGDGSHGKLGHGADQKKRFAESLTTPKRVSTFPQHSKLRLSCVSAGDSTSAVVTKDKKLFIWGKASYEKPHFGDFQSSALPRQFLPDRPIAKVSCGWNHTGALDDFGKAWMWGNGNEGCLGMGDEKIRQRPHLLVCMDDYHIDDIACGDKFTVILARKKTTQEQQQGSRLLTRQSSTEIGPTDQDLVLKKLKTKIHGSSHQQEQRLKQQHIYSKIIERIKIKRFTKFESVSPVDGKSPIQLLEIDDLDRQVEKSSHFQARNASLPPIKRRPLYYGSPPSVQRQSPDQTKLLRIQSLAHPEQGDLYEPSGYSPQVQEYLPTLTSGSDIKDSKYTGERFMDGQSVSHLIHNCFNSRKHSTASSQLYTGRSQISQKRGRVIEDRTMGERMFRNVGEATIEDVPYEALKRVQRSDLHQHFSNRIVDAKLRSQLIETSPEQRGDLFEVFMDGVFNKNDEKPCHALARKIRKQKSRSPVHNTPQRARSPLESKLSNMTPNDLRLMKLRESKSVKKRRFPLGYYTKPEYLKNLPALLPGDSPSLQARKNRIKK